MEEEKEMFDSIAVGTVANDIDIMICRRQTHINKLLEQLQDLKLTITVDLKLQPPDKLNIEYKISYPTEEAPEAVKKEKITSSRKIDKSQPDLFETMNDKVITLQKK